MERIIFHVDMDAFYASVEQLDFPEHRGKPVIVGGTPGSRGVVSAASYEARKFGVRSAMPIQEAHRRCPGGVFLPVRMSRYAEVSRQIQAIFGEYSPLVQTVSIDEAFLDMTGCCHLHHDKISAAQSLKREIRAKTQLTASIGIAPSRLVAKIASDLDKPDGLTVVEPNEVGEFLGPLPVRKIWGIGPKTEEGLRALGIHTVAQLRDFPLNVLSARFGSAGPWFREMAWGRDDSEVEKGEGVKSISHETTFERDESDPAVIRRTLLELSEMVGHRARRSGLRGRTVHLNYRDPSFQRHSRSHSLKVLIDQDMEIFEVVEKLWQRENMNGRKVRLVGVGLESFSTEAEPMDLFTDEVKEKKRLAQQTFDQIAKKWGRDSIGRAVGIDSPETETS